MKINGREYKMLLTVRARREIRALCPGGDLTKIGELYENDADGEEITTKMIMLLSRGYEDYTAYWNGQSGQAYEPCPITEEVIENLSMEEYRALSDEAADAFMRGMGVTIETEPVKEKGKKKAGNVIPLNSPTPGSSSTATN